MSTTVIPLRTHLSAGAAVHQPLRIIEDHTAWMVLHGMSPRTIDSRKRWLYRLHRRLPHGLMYASSDDLTQTMHAFAVEGSWGKQSLATYSRHARGFYRWAIQVGRLAPPDPSEALPRPSVPRTTPRPATDEELRVALERARDPYRLWVLLAAYAGLRCIEIARLSREDVTERGIAIRAGKGDKPAWVPTHPLIWQAVRDLPPGQIARRADNGEPVTTERYISYAWCAYARRIGITVGMHQFRHWFGTTALRNCGNVHTVQNLLRHASITTTVIYTAVSDMELTQAVESLTISPQGVAR